VILLDTHAWIWRVSDPGRLSREQREVLQADKSGPIAVSAISLWEVAKLVELGRLVLDRDVRE
jgi:PIN domain nuclease of toxin-antitoxin system